LVKMCIKALQNYEKYDGQIAKQERYMMEVSNCISGMKVILYGDGEKAEAIPEQGDALAADITEACLLGPLLLNLSMLQFEARKDFVVIFGNILRRKEGKGYPSVEYLQRETNLLDKLVEGYGDRDIAQVCGQLLRVLVEFEPLAKYLLYSDNFMKFFDYVEYDNFDVASDAFLTFKDLLTTHKALCAEFLEANYDTMFERYTTLLHSPNYVTKRQSLKLLGELLLDRANFNVMTKYISEQDNLILMMNLLRDKSKNIQFEAFHVFKVFVANPNKAPPILDILVNNKDKLITFLDLFHNDKEDEQFADEKAFLLKQIEALPDP